MKNLSRFMFCMLLIAGLLAACGDDDDFVAGLNPPQQLIALPSATSGAVTVDLYWLTDVDYTSFIVYGRIGDSPFRRLFDSSVTAPRSGWSGIAAAPTAPGPGGIASTVCGDVRISIDPNSDLLESYYIRYRTADGRISPASRTVSFVPTDLADPYPISITWPFDGADSVELLPTFTWDFVDTTMTYVVKVQENDQIVWMYGDQTSVFHMTDSTGVIYVPHEEGGLSHITYYTWQVWAISDTYCGMAVDEAGFTTE